MFKRDPAWRFRRALGHKTVANKKRKARRLACRKTKGAKCRET